MIKITYIGNDKWLVENADQTVIDRLMPRQVQPIETKVRKTPLHMKTCPICLKQYKGIGGLSTHNGHKHKNHESIPSSI